MDTTYWFRAEFPEQVEELQTLLPKAKFLALQMPEVPDLKVRLITSLSMEQIMYAMQQIPESWVMVETLNYEGDYTGKRDFTRSRRID